MNLRLGIAGLALILSVASASAHRLDEYLQAAFITLEPGAVKADLMLTPGVAVLPTVMRAIDPNHDGVISEAEQRGYIAQILRDLVVTVNGENVQPQLLSADFPSGDELKEGLGSLHLALKFELPKKSTTYRLSWENRHLKAVSVYQVNCLLPATPGLRIVSDHHNYSQSKYEVDVFNGALETAWVDQKD